MYKKILVPLDGSALAERAITHAAEIARGAGAELILLEVVQVPLAKTPEAGSTEEIKSIQEIAAQSKIYLNMLAARVGKEGVKVRTVVMEGAADGAILGFAHNEDVDIIVMSTHGRTGLSKALMGSVAEKVMLTTKRPVMLVKPEKVPVAHHIDETETFVSAH
ncbi:MAG TPA: universal stress protein [Candidatus Deferrimicrobiaceae bacterium]|jgi:nucleotide-binding universal stress UspA family protein